MAINNNKSMNILGLHLGHDATAALIVNNRLVAMVERERLTRIKYDRGFMPEMIDKCLQIGNIQFRDIDYIALSLSSGSSDSPEIKLDDLWGITITKNGAPYINGPRQILPWECEDGIVVKFDGIERPAFQVQHHISHAASSFYLSNYDKAISLSYDGSGSPAEQTSLICKCEGTKIDVEGVPNLNTALYYGVVSRLIYGSWRDSGKLMGLAAYGKPAYFDESYLGNHTIFEVGKILKNFWPDPKNLKVLYSKGWNQPTIVNFAASIQKWMEEDIKQSLDFIELKYGKCNMVISGGGALNVICNRIIYDRFPVFCAPFPKDDGLAAGGALYVLHHVFDVPRETYSTADITFLGSGDSSWEQYSSTQLHLKTEIELFSIAQELAEGKVVLWHQGRSEVGPRALTHRSIFASALSNEYKILVSEKIKGRETYRPLAPIVTAEDCTKYFDIEPNPMTELMLINANVINDKIPAVTHIDGTARVQTVSKEFNPIVYDLLKEYEKITNVPVLINTSLNIQGQAICETERDTLWTFDNCDVDICVIDNKVYRKGK